MISAVDRHNNNIMTFNIFFLQKSLNNSFLVINGIGWKEAIGHFDATTRIQYIFLKQLSIDINHIIIEPLSKPNGPHSLIC